MTISWGKAVPIPEKPLFGSTKGKPNRRAGFARLTWVCARGCNEWNVDPAHNDAAAAAAARLPFNAQPVLRLRT